MWVYANIFPPLVLGIFAGTLALLAFCWYIIAISGTTILHGEYDSEPFTYLNGLGVVGLFWFQLDYPTLIKKKLSSKILFLVSALMCFVVFETYAGDLTAYMASGDCFIL